MMFKKTQDDVDIERYLQKQGIKYKAVEGGSELECTCIYCGKEKHMYVTAYRNSKQGKVRLPGFHKCMKCGEGGGIWAMKRQLGDLPDIAKPSSAMHSIGGSLFRRSNHEPAAPSVLPPEGLDVKYHEALISGAEGTSPDKDAAIAWAYMTEERCIPAEVLRSARVGFFRSKKGIPCLAFPYYDRTGRLFNFKFLGLYRQKKTKEDGSEKIQKFIRRYPDCASDLYGLEALENEHGSALIVEGEIDRLSYMAYGFKNVLSVPNGAGNAKWDHQWTRHLANFETVYFSYDMDEQGRSGARDAAEKVGRLRCYDVQIPLNDCNRCLQAGITPADMAKCFEDAERFPGGEVKSVHDLRAALKSRLKGGDKVIGTNTGYSNINILLGGWREGELTGISGDTGSGKTEFCLTLALEQSRNGIAVLYCNFEMPPIEMAAKLITKIAQKDFLQLREEELDAAIDELDALPFYFLDAFGAVGMENLREVIEYCARYLGIGAFWLDPLQYALSIEDPRYTKHYIDAAMMLLKSLAMEFMIRIGLVIHPKNIAAERKSQKVEKSDLPGSARIKQDLDNIARLYVKSYADGTLDDFVEFTFLKIRSSIGRLGTAYFLFDVDSATYTPTEPRRSNRRKQSTPAPEQDPDPKSNYREAAPSPQEPNQPEMFT